MRHRKPISGLLCLQHGVGDNGHCVYGPQSLGESVFPLITTYAGFIFWRFQTAVQGEGEFAQDALFLGLYWLVFTAADFFAP